MLSLRSKRERGTRQGVAEPSEGMGGLWRTPQKPSALALGLNPTPCTCWLCDGLAPESFWAWFPPCTMEVGPRAQLPQGCEASMRYTGKGLSTTPGPWRTPRQVALWLFLQEAAVTLTGSG